MVACKECERLSLLCADLVKQNAELLTPYLEALSARDVNALDQFANAIESAQAARAQQEVVLSNHRATHREFSRHAGSPIAYE